MIHDDECQTLVDGDGNLLRASCTKECRKRAKLTLKPQNQVTMLQDRIAKLEAALREARKAIASCRYLTEHLAAIDAALGEEGDGDS